MGRARIPIGGYGDISYRVLGHRKVRALCLVRDTDGRLRQVTAQGSSNTDARTRLLDAIDNRPGFGGADLDRDTLLEVVADLWLADMARRVADSTRAPNTLRVYRSAVKSHIKPGVGGLRLRDANVPRMEAFLLGMRAHHGAGITKTARTVLNGILGYAIRHGAITVNPIRDVSRISGAPIRRPRALTQAERDDWLARLEADEVAVWHDLPDFTRIMLATGVRIGECLALGFDGFDRDDKTVAIDWNIVRVDGVGLCRMSTKTSAGERTLGLPGWAVDVLVRRGDELGWTGPVFPSITSRRGGVRRRVGGTWRDPSNTGRCFREARDRAGYGWVTSHAFRKTVATVMDEAGMTAREIADQLGHTRPSMTQDVYMGRNAVGDGFSLEDMFTGPDEDNDLGSDESVDPPVE